MKIKTILLLTSLALGSARTINAQQGPGDQNGPPPGGPSGSGKPRHHRPPPPLIMLALDTNHDGIIDANEIANASAALKTLDKNGDGVLTPDEYLGPRPPGAPDDNEHRPPLPPVVLAIDTNHDGIIDANEIANAPAALKTLDKNGDGQLTRDELRPPRPPGDDMRGPGREQDGPPSGPPPND